MKNPLITGVSKDYFGNHRYAVTLPTATATAHAATATLSDSALANLNHTNTGAGGAIVLTLPSANTIPMQGFRVYVTVAEQISLSPLATEKVWLAGSGVLDKDLVIAGAIGNYVDIYSDGTDYHAVRWSGVVTKEA
jgi:hypothetical protein